jgi:UDP-N-acetylglucosamine 2-epimerase (non-hydrolysing)
MDCAVRSNGRHRADKAPVKLLSTATAPEVHLIAGTRPEAVKLAPVAEAMRVRGRMRPVLVASGQHETMPDHALAAFGMRPDVRLRIERKTGSQPELFGDLVLELDKHLAGRRPAAVVVQGDTTTTLAAALVAFWHKIPVVHLEAGLRSHDLRAPFPEEAHRRLVAQVSSLHLVPTMRAMENLRAEGIGGPGVLMIGNTAVDAALWVASRPVYYSDPRLEAVEWRARCRKSRLLLVTVHRKESWGPPLGGILAALQALLERHRDVEIVLPVYPDPQVRKQVMAGLFGMERVHVTAPLPYAEFCRLLRAARLVLTDSGGIQEEAPSFGVPVLVLREVTDRTEAVEAGCAALVGTDPKTIETQASQLLENSAERRSMIAAGNPFGDGRAAQRAEHAIAWMLGLERTYPAAVSSPRLVPIRQG